MMKRRSYMMSDYLEVLTAFSYLNQYGYIIKHVNDNEVIFECSNNQFAVRTNEYSMQIDCAVESLSGSCVLGWSYQYHDRDSKLRGIKTLSEIVKGYIEENDFSKNEVFNEIALCFKKNATAANEEKQAGEEIREADYYWKTKQYKKAEKLYVKNRDRLLPSQEKKLEMILKKHIEK